MRRRTRLTLALAAAGAFTALPAAASADDAGTTDGDAVVMAQLQPFSEETAEAVAARHDLTLRTTRPSGAPTTCARASTPPWT
jgi:hypothetical protein